MIGVAAVRRLGALWAVLSLVVFLPGSAVANPVVGEGRSIVREPDRIYTAVAGEADGASTVNNPANLGFLKGINGVLDAMVSRPGARRRGSGVGLLLGIPLPFQILSLGLGYQFTWRRQPDSVTSSTDPLQQGVDESWGKLSLAAAVPLMRWVKGLSVGLSYGHSFSATNPHADGADQVDVGIGYRANRFLSLGLVGRALNQPRTGHVAPSGGERGVLQPLVLDPEIAFRPLGRPGLELAFGARIVPRAAADMPWATHVFSPRGRLLLGIPGVRLYVEAERYMYFAADMADAQDAVKVSTGVVLDFPHFGIAAGPVLDAGGAGGPLGGMAARVRVSGERYASFEVQPRMVTRLPVVGFRGERGMWELVRAIDDVGKRRGVVLLELQGLALGWAQVEEVREAVLRVRARGGKVVAYLEGGGLRAYFLASAADRIVAHPNGSLAPIGIRVEAFYFGDLLAKLGARAEFVRIAEYKGTPELYERATATAPVAEQRKQLVVDTWNHVLRLVARERGYEPTVVSQWIDDAPHTSARARQLAMIDAVAFPDALDRDLETWLGRRVRLEKPSRFAEKAERWGLHPRVAVVLIEGDLLDGSSAEIPILGRKIAGAVTLTETIKELREDRGVRAVVVRIDSPGGSVSAADAIAHELDLTRADKPVVVSMGNTAASGGYYIATAGQYVFADATTITGSIGIFYPKVDLSGVADKFGVGIDSFGLGAHSGMRSWWKPYSDDERAAVMRDIRASYDVFLERVGRARAMDRARTDAVARGRVFAGIRALEVGLVDAYGGLREAVVKAAAMARLRPGDYDVVVLPKPMTLLQQIRSLFGIRFPRPLVEGPVAGVSALGGLGVPTTVLWALRHLPTPLWFVDAPQPLALGLETVVLDD